MEPAPNLACIVEGHGEIEALPVLIRRVGEQLTPPVYPSLDSSDVLRVPKSRLLRSGELERHVELLLRKYDGLVRILVLVDADDDCPAELGPRLLERAESVRPEIDVSVVIAKSEFESWLIAGCRSLAGKCGLARDLKPPSNVEAIRGAKEWLKSRMPSEGRIYKETQDQASLTANFDMDAARNPELESFSPSFDKMWRELSALLAASENSS